jgi:hypothetical protein
MRASPLLLIALAGLAGCGDNDGSGVNAPVLWLALDGRETEVRLVEAEPAPF